MGCYGLTVHHRGWCIIHILIFVSVLLIDFEIQESTIKKNLVIKALKYCLCTEDIDFAHLKYLTVSTHVHNNVNL